MSKAEKDAYVGVMRRRYAVMRTKKARSRVLDEFCGRSDFIKRVPFEVLCLNSDNGGEHNNGHIKRHFAEFLPAVARSRSRRGPRIAGSPGNRFQRMSLRPSGKRRERKTIQFFGVVFI